MLLHKLLKYKQTSLEPNISNNKTQIITTKTTNLQINKYTYLYTISLQVEW